MNSYINQKDVDTFDLGISVRNAASEYIFYKAFIPLGNHTNCLVSLTSHLNERVSRSLIINNYP